MKKRWFAACIVLGVLLAALIGRLAYIQLAGHKDLAAAASAQQLISLEGANTRGLIYDRNSTPMVGNNRHYIYIIKGEQFNVRTRTILEDMDAREVRNNGAAYKVYTSKSYDKDHGDKLIDEYDAYIIEAGRRYNEDQTAVHLLGYINPQDTNGATGVEFMCNDQLALLKKKIHTIADVKGNIISGRGLVVTTALDQDSYVKNGITTTLETGLQNAVEEALAKESSPAAAVVLGSQTGEILASASTPTFDPNKINAYMNSTDNELLNKVTQGEYPPGSVFKIVVAAAALEEGIKPSDTFNCNGYAVINGKKVKCKTGGETGHGKITFEEAFADSCNSAFIQIGQKIGPEAILDMAEKFALAQKTMDSYPGEKAGNLMTTQQSAGAAIANLSIGQGEMLVTPLQVARMTNVIAADGMDPGIKILLDKEVTEDRQILSKDTAIQLSEMMKGVIDFGSGKNIKTNVDIAAKTGSAENNINGQEFVHGWVTGFVPAEAPEYTITVFVEDGESGSQSAGPIFKEIVEYLSHSASFETPVSF